MSLSGRLSAMETIYVLIIVGGSIVLVALLVAVGIMACVYMRSKSQDASPPSVSLRNSGEATSLLGRGSSKGRNSAGRPSQQGRQSRGGNSPSNKGGACSHALRAAPAAPPRPFAQPAPTPCTLHAHDSLCALAPILRPVSGTSACAADIHSANEASTTRPSHPDAVPGVGAAQQEQQHLLVARRTPTEPPAPARTTPTRPPPCRPAAPPLHRPFCVVRRPWRPSIARAFASACPPGPPARPLPRLRVALQSLPSLCHTFECPSVGAGLQWPFNLVRVPDDYALFVARKLLRSASYKFIKQYSGMGCRKTYIAAKSGPDSYVAVVSNPNGNCTYPIWDEAATQNFEYAAPYFMKTVKHPLLAPCLDAAFSVGDQTAVVYRHHYSRGSLRDAIYNVSPEGTSADKYRKKAQGLSLEKIGKYGRQVLEALRLLDTRKIPFPHLKSTNVMMCTTPYPLCQLSDLEDVILGTAKPWYLPSAVTVSPEVYRFGLLLLEMGTGELVPEKTTSKKKKRKPSPEVLESSAMKELDQLLASINPNLNIRVRDILHTIFLPASEATIESLLEEPLFADAPWPPRKVPEEELSQPLSLKKRHTDILQCLWQGPNNESCVSPTPSWQSGGRDSRKDKACP
eukprot:gene10318-1866_t